MEVNLFVLFGILCRVSSIILILFIVIPVQLREFKYPKDSLTVYRWLLFGMSLAFISLSILPFIYQLDRIDTAPDFNLQNIASVSGNLAVLLLSLLYSGIYILANRNRR